MLSVCFKMAWRAITARIKRRNTKKSAMASPSERRLAIAEWCDRSKRVNFGATARSANILMSIVFPVRVGEKHIYIQQCYYVSLGPMINGLEKDGLQESKMAESNGKTTRYDPTGNVYGPPNEKKIDFIWQTRVYFSAKLSAKWIGIIWIKCKQA